MNIVLKTMSDPIPAKVVAVGRAFNGSLAVYAATASIVSGGVIQAEWLIRVARWYWQTGRLPFSSHRLCPIPARFVT